MTHRLLPAAPASRRARRAVTFLALVLVALPAARAADWVYIARPGDNLWNLSKEYLTRVGYWRQLQTMNAIENPRRIPPGTPIRMPVRWLKVQPASARAVQVRGDAVLVGADGGRPLTEGAEVHIGDRVRTGAEGGVTLEFADGSRMYLREASEVEMDALSAYGRTGMADTRVRLQGGRVENRVIPARGPASRFQITTPAAVAAVRGTEFRVASDPDGATRSEVVSGLVDVAGERARRQVAAGFGTVAEVGKPPAPPRALLPAPDTGTLPARVERPLVDLRWPAVAGAVAYRAELYADAALERLLVDKRVGGPAVQFDAPPDGDYVVRLRAVDAVGLEGRNADHAFTIDARPLPPTLLEPRAGAALHGAPPELWWSVPEGVVSFHLQLARDAEFADLVADAPELTGSRLRPEGELPPGRYHWRLASRDGSGEIGPFGDAQTFRMLAVPAPVETEAPGVDANGVRFAWQPAADAARYEFQLASDAGFEDVLEARTVAQTEVTLPRPGPGLYYFRVRGVSAEDVAGPFTPVNRVEVPLDSYWPLLVPVVLPLLLLVL